MGDGYDFVCKKCKKEYSVMHGIGMMYPTIYQETIEDAKNGKYGSEWQELISSSKYIAINAEREVYICSSCGKWKTELDLSLYRPKDEDAIRTKQFGIKTVEEWGYVPYVFGQDFQAEYDLIKVYAHKCDHCGKRMHKANEEELSKLSCPYCGTENTSEGLLMWD